MKLGIDPAAVHALAAWFRDHGRPYHFRRHPTPYSVWILEVMSQQTQIARAEERHRRWLEHFPDIRTLAAAGEEEVLREWEGLGYYSRARNIHRAACQVMDAGGEMPTTRDGLLSLPGIGAYTAASIASIVHGEPVAAVDANVRRVLRRVFAAPDLADGRIETLLAGAFEHEPAGVINEALMELGEQLCRKTRPRCLECPLAESCLACRSGRTELERQKPGSGRTRLSIAVACLRCRGRFLVEEAPQGELWAGLWRFPCRIIGQEEDPEEVVRQLGAERGLRLGLLQPLGGKYTGGHTRYSIHLLPYCGSARRALRAGGAGDWIDPREDGGRTFPTLFRRLLEALPVKDRKD